jgi:crotonobetainyl-CoA:carnitine CoA-transferase CaiB-like acyl-CoA transferase
MLGLAAADLPMPKDARSTTRPKPWKASLRFSQYRLSTDQAPRVVNLGSLWAAPLCAHLLHRCGMRVSDIESTYRPDVSPAEFYVLLHDGHQRVALDFASTEGRATLARHLHDADVVLEASRPRALRALGVGAEEIMTDGRERVWLRITGHGQAQNRIAFGDDAAVGGGLVAWDATGPVFAGDAIADPLTGIIGAVIASACIRAGGSWLIDLSMTEVARYAVRSEGPNSA